MFISGLCDVQCCSEDASRTCPMMDCSAHLCQQHFEASSPCAEHNLIANGTSAQHRCLVYTPLENVIMAAAINNLRCCSRHVGFILQDSKQK